MQAVTHVLVGLDRALLPTEQQSTFDARDREVGLALLMVGAVALHLRAGDPFRIAPGFLQRRAESIRGWIPAAALGMLAIASAALILAE